MNVLVTEGLGYIERHTCCSLLKLGWEAKLGIEDMCKASYNLANRV